MSADTMNPKIVSQRYKIERHGYMFALPNIVPVIMHLFIAVSAI